MKMEDFLRRSDDSNAPLKEVCSGLQSRLQCWKETQVTPDTSRKDEFQRSFDAFYRQLKQS